MRYPGQNCLLGANLLIPIAVLVFAAGFFRYKPSLTISAIDDALYSGAQGDPEPAPFDRVVFMVIDALRSDFAYSNNSGFQFTQSLIRSGAAVPFTAHAGPPSLTITRVKAMTTGSNPSFLDLFLNLADDEAATTLSDEDTWLARWKEASGKKLTFYGENTWLQLFPDAFDRQEGVHAFFVPDFTEVDNNVTRHVTRELKNDDWSALVLHFPGLDHVGHVGGAQSPYMLPKQREMDAIIQEIFEAIENKPHLQSTLFVVGGDHGMTEKGNHGGSSPGESSPALMFMSPRLKALSGGRSCPTVPIKGDFDFYSGVDQSDIVPTLAGLLGFPVPKNSLGVFIPDFLPLWKATEDRVRLLHQNAAQLMNIFTSNKPQWEDEGSDRYSNCTGHLVDDDHLRCLWGQIKRTSVVSSLHSDEVLRSLYEFCNLAQRIMGVPDGNLSVPLLCCGMVVALIATLLALAARRSSSHSTWSFDELSFGMVTGAHGVTMFGAYVLNEHKFWYYGALAWLAYLGSVSATRGGNLVNSALPLVIQAVVQGWDEHGDSLPSGTIPDMHSYTAQRPLLLWSFITLAYLLTAHRLSSCLQSISPRALRVVIWPIANCLGLTALAFKFGSTAGISPELVVAAPPQLDYYTASISLPLLARVVFAGLALTLVYIFTTVRGKSHVAKGDALAAVSELMTFYVMTQSRAMNVPMFLLFRFQVDSLLSSTSLNPTQTCITTVLLSQSAFFSLGGSNSIASIDIPNGYNGVKVWSSVGVPAQVIAGNFAGSLWWSCAGLTLLFASSGNKRPTANGVSNDKVVHTIDGKGNGALTKKRAVNGKGPADNRQVFCQETLFSYHLASLSAHRAFSVMSLMGACLRLHLEQDPALWNVVAPSYVFAGLWNVVVHPFVNAIFCSLVWWAVVNP